MQNNGNIKLIESLLKLKCKTVLYKLLLNPDMTTFFLTVDHRNVGHVQESIIG